MSDVAQTAYPHIKQKKIDLDETVKILSFFKRCSPYMVWCFVGLFLFPSSVVDSLGKNKKKYKEVENIKELCEMLLTGWRRWSKRKKKIEKKRKKKVKRGPKHKRRRRLRSVRDEMCLRLSHSHSLLLLLCHHLLICCVRNIRMKFLLLFHVADALSVDGLRLSSYRLFMP